MWEEFEGGGGGMQRTFSLFCLEFQTLRISNTESLPLYFLEVHTNFLLRVSIVVSDGQCYKMHNAGDSSWKLEVWM
jgi:hypothetical protein